MGKREIQHKLMRGAHGQTPNDHEVKDWSREDSVQILGRTQIRPWVREEFLNRWRNFGLQYTHKSGGEANNENTLERSYALNAMESEDMTDMAIWDKNIYKGPKKSWVRVVSSAIVKDEYDETKVMHGFVLTGNGNFHDTFGFGRGDGVNGGGGDALTLLGFDINGKRHEIAEPDYKHRPTPGITGVESADSQPGQNFRKTIVNFSCWSLAQLDYLESYFFQPGISMVVEWGWNTYPRGVLLPLNIAGYADKMVKLWNNEKDEKEKYSLPPASRHFREGQGNYGYAMGLISKFNYGINDSGGYDCVVEVSCMSEIGSMIMKSSGREEKRKGTMTLDIQTFCKSTLRRLLVGNDDNDYTRIHFGKRSTDKLVKHAQRQQTMAYNAGKSEDKSLKQSHLAAIKISRGRFFSFDPYSSTKPYYAGKSCGEGVYITVGYLIDIFNIFFKRESTEKAARICEFSCFGSRCVAHPNIKSVDGSVLLIPNSLAPRWNTSTYHGSTLTYDAKTKTSSSASYNVLMQGESPNARLAYKETTQSFLDMCAVMLGRESSGLTLEEALSDLPRDDLHKIFAFNGLAGYDLQHPIIGRTASHAQVSGGKKIDKLKEAWVEATHAIKPFPDYMTDITSGPSKGYSGRIADLLVSLKTIDDAMEGNDNASVILMDIMKKVSTAAGGIWEFQMAGGDKNSSSNTILQLIDAKFTGIEPVETQKDLAWVFPCHRGDSIVRELTVSVDPKSDIASQIVFDSVDAEHGYYKRSDQDLILRGANNPMQGTQTIKDAESTKPEMADNLKYIVALSGNSLGAKRVGLGMSSYPVDKDLRNWDVSYRAKKGTKKSKTTYHNNPHGPGHTTTNMVDATEGEFIVLKGRNRTEMMENLEKARQNGKETTIKTGSTAVQVNDGKSETRTFGAYSSGTGMSDVARRRIFKVFATNKFYERIGGSGDKDGEEMDDAEYEKMSIGGPKAKKASQKQLRNYLLGKVFTTGKDIKFDEMDDAYFSRDTLELVYDPTVQPEPPDGEYEIISARTYEGTSVVRAKHVKETWGRDSGHRANLWHHYELGIQEVNGKGLSQSDHHAYAIARQNGLGIPEHLKDKMKKRGLSEDDVLKEKFINDSSLSTSHTSSQFNLASVSTTGSLGEGTGAYGTHHNDYEIDIETVDPDVNRMRDNCKLDVNISNNMIFNQPCVGVDLSLKLDGIEGLRLWDVFSCDGMPSKHYDRGLFGITSIKHSITGGDWTTDIEGLYYISK